MAAPSDPDTVPAAQSMLELAQAYARDGWPVFPAAPAAKHPLTSHGHHDATCDPDQIRRWWNRWPAANIAAPTGATGIGYDVLDLDGPRAERTLQSAFAEGALSADDILGVARSGRRPGPGRHLYLASAHGRRTTVGRRPGIDIRAAGAYVLLPGSVHATGRRYQWTARPPQAAPPPTGLTAWDTWYDSAHRRGPAPPQARQASRPGGESLGPHHRWARDQLARWSGVLGGTRPGQRRDTLNRAAFHLARLAAGRLLDMADVSGALVAAARRSGLPEEEISRTLLRAVADGAAHPWQPPPTVPGAASVAAVTLAASLDPARWAGRTGLSDWAVFSVLLGLAEDLGRTTNITASVRTLIERTGLASQTVRNARDRLVDDDWLIPGTRATSTRAAGYTIGLRTADLVPGRLYMVPKLHAVNQLLGSDAFTRHGLGPGAARILALLQATPHAATADLTAASGLHPATVRRHLAALTAAGLIHTDGGRATAASDPDLQAVADLLGATGTVARRTAQHDRQRLAWRTARARYGSEMALLELPEPDGTIGYVDQATGEIILLIAA